MKKCIYCQQKIEDTAKVCHHCSHYQSKWARIIERSFLSTPIIISIIAMIFTVLQVNYAYKQTTIADNQ